MRAKDFISELNVGSYMKGGTTPSKSHIQNKNAKIAYDVVKSISNADTAKEKIEIITNLSAGKTSNKIVVVGPADEVYTFRSYDKDSGQLSLSFSNRLFTADVNSLEFLRKERSPSTTIKKWIFKVTDVDPQGKIKTAATNVKKGRPSKPTFTMPDRLW